MTDYHGAVDALDAMVESRERGYVCAVSVHSLTSALDDPEMTGVFRGATLVAARRHAASSGRRTSLGARPEGTRLRTRADAPLQRALRRARTPRMAVRRARPGLARAARAEPAPPPARHQHRGRLLATVPADDRRGGGRARRPDQRRRPDVLWVGIGAPKQEKWMARMRDRLDVPVHVRRRRRVRLPRRAASRRRPCGCSSAGSSGSTAWPRSRAGCCRATCAPTRASCSRFARQYLGERTRS